MAEAAAGTKPRKKRQEGGPPTCHYNSLEVLALCENQNVLSQCERCTKSALYAKHGQMFAEQLTKVVREHGPWPPAKQTKDNVEWTQDIAAERRCARPQQLYDKAVQARRVMQNQ